MLSNKIMKKQSPIHGYGLFAIHDIKKGEILWTEDYKAKQITLEDFKTLKGKTKKEWDTYGYYLNNFVYLDMDDSRYWNHSFTPNTCDYENKCIAIHDIKKGEEMTWDYTNYLRPDEKIPSYMEIKIGK